MYASGFRWLGRRLPDAAELPPGRVHMGLIHLIPSHLILADLVRY